MHRSAFSENFSAVAAAPRLSGDGSALSTSEARFRTIKFGFGVLFFTLIFLQKIGIGSGDVFISLSIPVLYLVLAILGLRRCLSFSLWRLVLVTTFIFTALLSQIFVDRGFSVLSVLFILSLYLPFTIVWHLRQSEWLRIVSLFQDMMLVPAAMVFVQLGGQSIFHLPALSIEPFIPSPLLIHGFMYTAPIHWGHPLMRPNGFFMLEPSFISAFTATAFILEGCTFRRLPRIALYSGALFASTGATGLVLTAIAAPFLLARQSPGVILFSLILLLVGGGVAVETGVTASLFDRLSELQTQGSSGFGRLVAPFIQAGEVLDDPDSLITGMGAGNTSLVFVDSIWPLVKLGLEYGLPTALAFLVFNLSCFWRAPVPPLAAGLYVVFNFTGGYLVSPALVILIFLLVASPRIVADEIAPDAPGVSRSHTRPLRPIVPPTPSTDGTPC